jgi:HEAT repeat protein
MKPKSPGMMILPRLFLALLCAGGFAHLILADDKPPATPLLEQFKSEEVFWRQLEIAKKLVAAKDASVLRDLADGLHHEDRHLRGNVAFIFASFGDDRGFDVICKILEDRSDRPEGQGIAVASSDGRYHVEQQIKEDRYYAVHLLGELKDLRAVPVLIPLLKDEDLNFKIPWALAEIGDKRAKAPLTEALDDPKIRDFASSALLKLSAQ